MAPARLDSTWRYPLDGDALEMMHTRLFKITHVYPSAPILCRSTGLACEQHTLVWSPCVRKTKE